MTFVPHVILSEGCEAPVVEGSTWFMDPSAAPQDDRGGCVQDGMHVQDGMMPQCPTDSLKMKLTTTFEVSGKKFLIALILVFQGLIKVFGFSLVFW